LLAFYSRLAAGFRKEFGSAKIDVGWAAAVVVVDRLGGARNHIDAEIGIG